MYGWGHYFDILRANRLKKRASYASKDSARARYRRLDALGNVKYLEHPILPSLFPGTVQLRIRGHRYFRAQIPGKQIHQHIPQEQNLFITL